MKVELKDSGAANVAARHESLIEVVGANNNDVYDVGALRLVIVDLVDELGGQRAVVCPEDVHNSLRLTQMAGEKMAAVADELVHAIDMEKARPWREGEGVGMLTPHQVERIGPFRQLVAPARKPVLEEAVTARERGRELSALIQWLMRGRSDPGCGGTATGVK